MDDVQRFCRALWRNETAVVASLAPSIAPDASDRWGNTPLLSAARYGDLALVSLLVRRGARLDQGRAHLAPITIAAKRPAPDIVAFIIERGASVPLLAAILLGDRRRVARDLGGDPAKARLVDELGAPFLHHAAEALDAAMVALLLDHGAAVADIDATGETALHRVADLRQAEARPAAAMAALLLERGADPDARNRDEVTPLHQAVRARNLAVAEVLLEHGADANARDRGRGSTPLRRAVSANGAGGTACSADLMLALTQLLLRHGADPDACDARGVPVHAAARAPALRAALAAHRAAAPRVRARPSAAKRKKPRR